MKTIKHSTVIYLSVIVVAIAGCKKDDESLPASGSLNLTNGVFITNEGNFGSSDGSVTFFRTTSHEVIEDVFKRVNNRPLGDVVQSMTLDNNKGYIVVNNSRKIEVVNKNNFTSIGTINGFSSPRFLLPVNTSKAYVCDWFANNIKVIDMNSLTITDSIPAGSGPEQMALINNKVFVANVGGWEIDSTVTVIDATANSVITTIQTALNPNSVVTDANGKIWVLCNGWYGLDFTREALLMMLPEH